MTRLCLLVSTCLYLAGCSITRLAEQDTAYVVNKCTQDADCADEEQCQNAICIARDNGSLSTLLFEVTPGISAQSLSGVQLLKVGTMVPLVSGPYQLALDDVVTVTGSFIANGCDNQFLTADGKGVLAPGNDGSIPVRLTFAASQRAWGLVTTTVQATADDPSSTGQYSFSAKLPGGNYDVYVEPYTPSGQGTTSCSFLPQLFRAQDLSRSTSLKLGMQTPKHIDIKLRFPEGNQDLDGWRADMLEPVTGRVVSTSVELELPTRSDASLLYSFGIDYMPVWGDDPSITHGELLRLSPPSGVVAPTLFFWREGLEWASPGSGVIDGLDAFPTAISMVGRVAMDAEQKQGVPASVTLTASEISGVSAGFFPSFIQRAKTDDQGRFKVDLVPGRYKVIATPSSATDSAQQPLATSTSEWTVLGSPLAQAGMTLVVQPALDVQGSVVTPRGDGARGATVSAEASPAGLTTSVFQRAIGGLPAVPRATSAVIGDGSGAFDLFPDTGVYDLSVRPPAGSGFAWLVMPGFVPSASSNQTAMVELPDPLRLPAAVPIDLFAHLSARSQSESDLLLNGASVRAYALLDNTGNATTDFKAAVSAVRVAEARLDDTGQATLLLPAKLDRPPDGFAESTEPTP